MEKKLDELLGKIDPRVRREGAYSVGSFENIQVKVNQNENPFGLPQELKERISAGIAELDWNRYPDRFCEDLLDVLSSSLGVGKNSILIGNGSNELVYLLAQSLLSEGSKVALPDPMFSLYEKAARLQGADIIELPGDAIFDLQMEESLHLISKEQPDLIILTSPNNPTGRSISISDVEAILKISTGFVIVDEAYYEFLEGPNAMSLLDRYPNLIVLRTFSKALGLAGIRLGYIVAHPEIMTEFYKLRLPFMVDRISAFIAMSIMDELDLIENRLKILKVERDKLLAQLDSFADLEVIPSIANFILFKSPMKSDELVKALAKSKVLIRDMSGYEKLQNYVRVSVGTPAENKIFMEALSECGLK